MQNCYGVLFSCDIHCAFHMSLELKWQIAHLNDAPSMQLNLVDSELISESFKECINKVRGLKHLSSK